MQIDERRIAVFIDFENVAMGVRESRYGNFDIDLVLKRLVEKGKITVKRAYSDWHRYTEFKRAFHQAAIELIDVPQTRYSGKNSADIRMVVDALDLSYQRDHIDTFVLVSGDSDFSPLVSKLREYGRYVIGMGVKQSSSDLLINNCDEFIFYEDLVRPSAENTTLAPKLNGLPQKKAEALRLVVETFEALQREGKEVIFGSVIKQTLVRKLPSFNESYFGYPSFSRLLEDAAENKLLQLTKDQKSGGYIVTLSGNGSGTETPSEEPAETALSGGESPPLARKSSGPARTRSSRGRRQGAREKAKSDPQPSVETAPVELQSGTETQALPETSDTPAESPPPGEATSAEQSTEPPSPAEQSTESSPPAQKKPARPRRRSSRSRAAGSRKTAAKAAEESPPAEASAAPAPDVPPDQAPAEAPPDQPAESASASAASPAEGQSEVEQLPPGDTTPAEQSTEPSPAVEKKPARPRRRSSRSRAAGSRKAAAKAAEESPSTEALAAPAPEVPAAPPDQVPAAAPPDQVPAAAPPDQPAESASASAASPAEGQSEVEQLPPGDTTPAEQSTEPPPPVEKKPARPRRRSSRSRAAGSRKAAAKVAEEAPPAEASATPATEDPAALPDQVPAAAPPDQPAESTSATTPPSEEGKASVAEASPMEAPPEAAPLLSEAGAPTAESDSDGGTAPKRRKQTTTPRKRTTRGKTTRSRKKPAPDTEPTLFSQMQDGLD